MSLLPKKPNALQPILHSAQQATRRLAQTLRHSLLLALWAVLWLGCGTTFADQVTRSAQNCVNVSSTGSVAWSNPANALSTNDAKASVSLGAGASSNYLRCSNFGFSIPASARIDGVVVDVERNASVSTNNGSTDNLVRLIKSGTIGTSNRATTTAYTSTDTRELHGSASDLWGDVWTPSYVNHSSFGAAVSVKQTVAPGASPSINIDHIQVTVYYTLFPCTPPSNAPAGLALACKCDTFDRSNIQPSTIVANTNWILSTNDNTGISPGIVNPGYLRLTNATNDNAKSASIPGSFPAAGNYLSVEFRHFAYSPVNTGADGMGIVFSDASQGLQIGGGGSNFAYSGFAGGWLGVGLDEWGGFATSSQAVGARGSATSNNPLGNSGNLLTSTGKGIHANSSIPAYGDFYQIVVDSRSNTGTTSAPVSVAVNRDTSGGWGNYSNVWSLSNIFAANSSQSAPPANFRLTFTGATGGVNNIHEISAVRICGLKGSIFTEPTLGGFNAIDSSLSSSSATTGRIYTKLAGTAFNLKVAALNAAKTATETAYAITGNKTVTLDLFDDSVGASCNASASACSSCSKPKITTSQTLSFSSADAGFKTSANITVPNAYQRILARASDGTTTACATDVFAVRPSAFTSLSSSASNTALTSTPVFKTGTDSFSVTVGTAVAGYSGTPKINPAAMAANAPTWVLGSLSSTVFPAATTSGSNSTASGNFYYSEAGHFKFLGTASTGGNSAGIYDDTWTAVDQTGDCMANSFSNTLSSDGKYGCGFGLGTDSALLGRFVPDHFKVTASSLTPANTSFVYMGQAGLGVAYSVEARSGNSFGNSVVQNYNQGRVPVVNPTLVAEDQPSSNQSCNLGTRISGLTSTSWSNGKYTLPSTNTTFSRPANTNTALNASSAANCTATRDAAAGPFDFLDVGLQVADPDTALLGSDLNMRADTSGTCTNPTGGTSNAATNCNAQKLGSTSVRFGRIKLSNAYGAPRLALDIPVQAEYWMGTAFATNTWDSATPLSPPNKTTLPASTSPSGALGLYFYPSNPLGSSLTTVTVSTTVASTNYSNVLKNGRTAVRLSAPSSSTGTFAGVGFADLVFGVPSYLTGNWFNCSGQTGTLGLWDDYPCARAMFGIYASPIKLAYRRENY